VPILLAFDTGACIGQSRQQYDIPMFEPAFLMLRNRPAVVANVAAFVVLALAERGTVRTLLWLCVGTAIGWAMEFASTRTGFPFGEYVYHTDSFVGEWSAGGVPLFASLSFAALTYLGYSAACTLLSGLRGTGSRTRRSDNETTSWRVLVLSAVLITWMDVVIDPLTLLGRYWHLGDLYHYKASGIHFGVPLSNYGGWFFTSLLIVGTNLLLDRLLRNGGIGPSAVYALPFQPFWSIAAQAGTYLYLICVAAYLLAAGAVPAGIPLQEILMSTLVCSAAYAVFTAIMIHRAFRLRTAC
jgi:uncharacterized membrane protein